MRTLLTILVVALAATGCARHAVVDYQPGAPFGDYATWAWAEKDGEERVRALDGSRIEKALEEKLRARGFEQVERDRADLLVRYAVEERTRLDQSGFGLGLGMGRGGVGVGIGTRPPAREVKEGHLVVELAERESRQVIWRGVGQRALTEGMEPRRRSELISKQVDELFDRYPPE